MEYTKKRVMYMVLTNGSSQPTTQPNTTPQTTTSTPFTRFRMFDNLKTGVMCGSCGK
jgi:hypothetical protein